MKNLRAILMALLLGAGLLVVGCQPQQAGRPNLGSHEGGKGAERARVQKGRAFGPPPPVLLASEPGHFWETRWRVDKWHNEAERRAGRAPYAVAYAYHNILLTAGITRLENLLIGTGSTQAYDATHTRIGVGNGSTAVVIGDTDLSAAAGSANRWFQLVDQTSTISGGNVLNIHATFAAGDGNFVWNEFGTDAGTSSGNTVTAPLLNRKVQSLGTKVSPGVWAISETITISANWIERLLRPLPYAPKEHAQYALDA